MIDSLVQGRIFPLVLITIGVSIFLISYIIKNILLSYPDIILGRVSTAKFFLKDNEIFQTVDTIEDNLNSAVDYILNKIFSRPKFLFLSSGVFLYSVSFLYDMGMTLSILTFIIFIFVKPSSARLR